MNDKKHEIKIEINRDLISASFDPSLFISKEIAGWCYSSIPADTPSNIVIDVKIVGINESSSAYKPKIKVTEHNLLYFMFSNGRRFEADHGFVSINNGLEITQGFSDTITMGSGCWDEFTEFMNSEEKLALADHMIELWGKFKESVSK
jgi:hypothetical protein